MKRILFALFVFAGTSALADTAHIACQVNVEGKQVVEFTDFIIQPYEFQVAGQSGKAFRIAISFANQNFNVMVFDPARTYTRKDATFATMVASSSVGMASRPNNLSITVGDKAAGESPLDVTCQLQ